MRPASYEALGGTNGTAAVLRDLEEPQSEVTTPRFLVLDKTQVGDQRAHLDLRTVVLKR